MEWLCDECPMGYRDEGILKEMFGIKNVWFELIKHVINNILFMLFYTK